MKLVPTARPPDAATCERWSRLAMTSAPDGPPGAIIDRYEAPARIGAGDTRSALFTRLRDRVLTYDVFPPGIVQATIWPAGRVAVGATIVQRIVLGPLALEVAVRVIEVWDQPATSGVDGAICSGAAGFRYVTLQGHPECGVASFEVHIDDTGEVRVILGARSRPGHWLTRVGRPFARRFQQAMTRAALRRLANGNVS